MAKSLLKKDNLKLFDSKYTFFKYQTCFDDNLAKKYLVINPMNISNINIAKIIEEISKE